MARRRPSIKQDWRDAATATALLSVLFPDHRTPPNAEVRRKLRLVLCGAARTIWDRLPHDDLRRAVEVAERFADGKAPRRELDEARRVALRRQHPHWLDRRELGAHGSGLTEKTRQLMAAATHAETAAELIEVTCGRSVTVARTADRVLPLVPLLAAPMQLWESFVDAGWAGVEVGPDPAAEVVRDVFGGPTPARFADEWKTATVTAIAEGIAADGAFDRLPVLADALEDAGCESLSVLAHCRGPGPHWRGCWVVDGVRGR